MRRLAEDGCKWERHSACIDVVWSGGENAGQIGYLSGHHLRDGREEDDEDIEPVMCEKAWKHMDYALDR